MRMKVNPYTGTLAPMGFIWEYQVVLAQWVLVEE